MPRQVFGEPVWEIDDTVWLEQGNASSDVTPPPAVIPDVIVRIGRFALVRFVSRPEPERRPLGFRPKPRRS